MCGPHAMNWDRFLFTYRMIEIADKQLRGDEWYLRDDPRLIRALGLGNNWVKSARKNEEPSYLAGLDGQGMSLELLTLVTLLRKNAATEPRDKIYGVVGVAADLGSDSPGVNYESPLESVYGAYTQWFVNRYQDLCVLK